MNRLLVTLQNFPISVFAEHAFGDLDAWNLGAVAQYLHAVCEQYFRFYVDMGHAALG